MPCVICPAGPPGQRLEREIWIVFKIIFRGPQGERGMSGEPGTYGEQGPPGKSGIDGPYGRVWIFKLKHSYQLFLKEGPPGNVGIKGPCGRKGPIGDQVISGILNFFVFWKSYFFRSRH